jgi:hypothetical protein
MDFSFSNKKILLLVSSRKRLPVKYQQTLLIRGYKNSGEYTDKTERIWYDSGKWQIYVCIQFAGRKGWKTIWKDK